MVDFVKPKFLGSRDEFRNRFENPINNGRHADSTSYDVQTAKRRSYVLHKMLKAIVLRKDATILKQSLPPKHEFVVCCKLSALQRKLYEKYLEQRLHVDNQMHDVLSGFNILSLVGNHPAILKAAMKNESSIAEEENEEEQTENIPRKALCFFATNTSSATKAFRKSIQFCWKFVG
jgi:transcriptional regulator ATRX